MNNIKMPYFDRTNVSEVINVSKSSIPKECDICHNGYLLNKRFKF